LADQKSESSKAFFSQFLEDYFEESDELLTAVRVQLLTMEKFIDKPVDATLLNELFRAFHTLKGISAMVGLSEAESLAHNLESSLRILREANQRLTEERLTFLVDITESLVQLVEAHRAKTAKVNLTGDIANEPAVKVISVDIPDAAPSEQESSVSSGVRNWNFNF
jgi:two-component system, chemotaxis family, sensor kinase CheA